MESCIGLGLVVEEVGEAFVLRVDGCLCDGAELEDHAGAGGGGGGGGCVCVCVGAAGGDVGGAEGDGGACGCGCGCVWFLGV